jgi:hypothetical protein
LSVIEILSFGLFFAIVIQILMHTAYAFKILLHL